MWYFTKKADSDQRPVLEMAESESEANAARQALSEADPLAVLGSVFEETHDYQFSFPRICGVVSLSDGSEELVWTDGVRTTKT